MIIELGRIVKAIAGRDKENYFIIVGIIDESYVFVANGKNRKISRPKKKKLKHLVDNGNTSAIINEKLERNEKVKNSELRKALECIDVNE